MFFDMVEVWRAIILITEEYQELIERDAIEISWLWKYLQMFLYLLCTISGYTCSVLFYILWKEIFGDNCPLWATSVLISKEKLELDDIRDICKNHLLDWWKYIFTDYIHENTCEMYLITCFSSCIFGVVWFTLFLMCGKGGQDIPIYESPWRIVFPAICFNFIFAIISMYAHYNLQQGYKSFNDGIKNVSYEIYSICKMPMNISDCEIIKIYMKMHNFYIYDVCHIISYLQVIFCI
ncbi:uncharacterized protein LOC105736316 isoform X1 [Apis florea]|uniref:uncharacterized protein LOC105736316 isoform X1 n=1 Tax=Apis florea TaxID=7463 RepID=UPI0006296CA5|nr:uncharacterized protein LOC105736316 isoform X1 [Apis florea]